MSKLMSMLEKSRQDLEDLIDDCNGNLLNPFVIAASQRLDTLINKYNKFLIQ